MKYVTYTLFSIIALLLVFFGLGPVIFSDGTLSERLITLVVVSLILAILIVLVILYSKKDKEKLK